jgi:accessory Sec system glycosyltransferase GtfB
VLQRAGYEGYRVFFNTLSTSFFVSQSLPANDRGDVLFWQEPINNEIPGNMRSILNGTSARAAKVMVQRRDSYEKMLALGAPAEVISPLGFIYPFKKENRGKKEALICTNSENVAEINRLIEALPEVHFSVAAITEMSSKLMSLDKYSNVSLYPGVKMKVLDELFEQADFYLDINHESEIVSAVEKAFLHNHLIFAFQETLHNPRYVTKEHIFAKDKANELILELKAVMGNTALLNEELERQRAFAMLETKEKYTEI